MRKIKLFLFFILLVSVGVFAYKYNLDFKKEQSRNVFDEDNKKENVGTIKKQIDASAIIKKELKAVGILGLLEGTEEYKQLIEDESWYAYRGINIDWHYRFSIAVNCSDIGVEAKDDKVSILVDNKKLFIWFVEKTKESSSRSEASWLAKKFSSQEVEGLDAAVKEKISNKIKSTPEYWNQAQESLKANLVELCNELGFYNIEFKNLQ
jgi:hypothetical protein